MKLRHAVFWCALLSAASVSLGELGIGDPAPELAVTKWIKGSPVELAQVKGKSATVVEFWATWCGPCIKAIPHLTEMQREFGKDGVTFIGVTAKDPGNTLEQVTEFVEKQGDRMGYTVAFDGEGKTYEQFMTAAGEEFVPTAFVIDQEGRIAWIGHPMEDMDEVLREVIAGTYDHEVARKLLALAREEKEAWHHLSFGKLLEFADRRIALKPKAGSSYATKFYRLLQAGADEEKILSAATKAVALWDQRPDKLGEFASEIVGAGESGAFGKLAQRAIKRALEHRPDDSDLLIAQFQILSATGDDDRAVSAAVHALAVMHTHDDVSGLSRLAKVLSDPALGKRCDDLALRAIDMAIAAEPNELQHLLGKFQILAVCKRDDKAAIAIGEYLIEKAAGDARLLDSLSWSLMTERETEGRFSELALKAAKRCHKISEGKNWSYVDTLALALFETGDVAEAIKIEEKAIKLAHDQEAHEMSIEELELALARFRKSKE
ncbi:MAG: redoxin domain-containing protein [Planctomycetes bacterium]|nr:redoxin domain-containing protein [Planctomycetota bacterium]